MAGGLGVELGAQPLGLAGGAAHPPFGALGAAGGPGQREQALGGALRLGVGEPLAVHLAGKRGELAHGGHLLSPRWRASLVLHWRWPGRAVTIRSGAQEGHRIRLGVKAVLAPGTGWALASGRRRG